MRNQTNLFLSKKVMTFLTAARWQMSWSLQKTSVKMRHHAGGTLKPFKTRSSASRNQKSRFRLVCRDYYSLLLAFSAFVINKQINKLWLYGITCGWPFFVNRQKAVKTLLPASSEVDCDHVWRSTFGFDLETENSIRMLLSS